jgi:hypothetical protein
MLRRQAKVAGSTRPTPGALRHDDETATWIDIPTSGLSDTNAIVLLTMAALRFNPLANWYGTPGTLTARVSDGKGALPATGVQDISAGIGGAGQWLAGTITISEMSGVAITADTVPPLGKLWDRLAVGHRRQAALQWDLRHDPAIQQDVESAEKLEHKIEEWEATSTPTALDIPTKETNLARLRQELGRVLARIDAWASKVATAEPQEQSATPVPKASVQRDPPRKPTLEEVVEWYVQRVANHDPNRLPPTRREDEKAARQYFNAHGADGRGIRPLVRKAREKEAPPSWKVGGAKSHETYGANRNTRTTAE